MPGKVGVKIKAARNLPVMDKSSETTDAFVEIKLASVTHKTDVFRKSLNPTWNTDWFRFEVDDAELQDEPLQIRLMDYDTYSANDAIGKVNISLNPLCLESSSQAVHGKGTVLSGWIPVFDTMHGIRGEINVIVKVDLFSDVNKFRQSSCGIPFFHSQCVPFGYRAQVIHGFVEELVVNDDPEYQWIDKIRTPRASNEARQVVFLKLSGQVQRRMGLKAINMGANAVIGYTKCFDLEGDVGVVARGVGTAVTLIKDTSSSQPNSADVVLIEELAQKYLDFLNCTGASTASLPLSGRTPQYRLNIYRQPRSVPTPAAEAAAAATLFYLESGSSDTEDADLMQNLIKQEDERGERCREKKLTHRMRRLTLSSRNVFSEKYATLIRRIEPKIPENATQSLSSIFGGSGGAATAPSSFRQRRRRSRFPMNMKASPPNIVRSISNDTGVRPSHVAASQSFLTVPGLTEFQENTRSAPDLPVDEFLQLKSGRSSTYSTDSEESLRLALLAPGSNGEESLDEENLQDNWIRPGETRSCENSQPDLGPKHHNLLEDLRGFSRRLQQLMHLKPKNSPLELKPKHPSFMLSMERKPYYSSHPELPTCCSDEAWLGSGLSTSSSMLQLNHLPSYEKIMQRSVSFNHLGTGTATGSATATALPMLDEVAAPLPLPLPPVPPNTLLLNAPELRVCPSTPTPQTPTKSELLDSTYSSAFDFNPFVIVAKLDHSVNISNSTNLSNNNNEPSLLAPFAIQKQQQLRQQQQPRSSTDIQQQTVAGGGAGAGAAAQATPPPPPATATGTSGWRLPSPVNSSRLKMTPSPSKSGISAATNADSASTSTASTATTMVPATVGEICRRSSDSDLSVTPKGNSICVASERLVAATAMMRLTQPAVGAKAGTAADSLDMLEYPFLTMTKYPTGFILHLGATVAASSVKLLERVPNPDEPEVRDSWWTELRMEIRSHARSLGCNVVLGYAETTTISDDVCVLSATGTAAVINMVFNRSVSQTDLYAMSKATTGNAMSNSLEEANGSSSGEPSASKDSGSVGTGNSSGGKRYGMPPLNGPRNACAICHIPYNLSSVPFNVKMKKCAICRKGRVPDVLLATLEVPEYMQVTGRGCFMQAQVVRAKRDLRAAELNAKEISDGLPFLEYELHRVLINKLKAKGMNAIFGLRTQVAIGERMIALIATGTALFLTALPVPQVPKIVAGTSWTDKQKLNELQKKLQETFERNQEIYQLKSLDPDLAANTATATGASGGATGDKQSDTDDSDEEEMNEIDLNCGNKELCVLEVDDIEDLEIISLLMEPYPPEGFHVVNTQQVPGMHEMDAVKNLQMFTQVWRARLEVGQSVNGFPKHFQRLLQTIYFKLRTMIPCAICDLRFRLELPESDQIQLLVTGMAMGLSDANKMKYRRRPAQLQQQQNGFHEAATIVHEAHSQPELTNGKRMLQEEDYIFPLDEDQMVDTPTPTSTAIPPFGMSSFKMRKTSPSRLGQLASGLTPSSTGVKSLNLGTAVNRNRYFPLRDRYGVDLTPLSFIPGGRIEKYLGNLNFFFIRESTSIREIGGISGFVHGFITELLAVVRAHIASLGGNAMVSFYITELILFDNQHKNQGQCLISIGGDAVYVSYYSDD
ncbi:C2 domain-containing protein 5 isoform X1 [Drosophila obscura]|uniref:C2 domain-containing protein 5 isoform X1 n=1 Tax=Drosophila obscura TaxID=7282 RepID=UPI001BB159DC|nr:C2 domain-containing protein 5 isoform X1 [Drosophila obscura]